MAWDKELKIVGVLYLPEETSAIKIKVLYQPKGKSEENVWRKGLWQHNARKISKGCSNILEEYPEFGIGKSYEKSKDGIERA